MLDNKIVEIDNKKILIINRSDLDELIKQSQAMKEKLHLKFDKYDKYTLLRLQYKNKFIIISTKGLNIHDNTITYSGVTFKDDVPVDNNFEMIISDLDHLSSTRFAYAAYNLMHINQKKYSQALTNTKLNIQNDARAIMLLDKYFSASLDDYFKRI